MILIENPSLANDLAEALISDLVLLETERVHKSRLSGTLFEELSLPIEAARQFYTSQVSPHVVETYGFFEHALVNCLYFNPNEST